MVLGGYRCLGDRGVKLPDDGFCQLRGETEGVLCDVGIQP